MKTVEFLTESTSQYATHIKAGNMKSLITRKEALKNKVFASFIGNWQKQYDPRLDQYMIEAGDYHDWALNKERYYSQSEIDLINKQELNDYLRLKDDLVIKEYEYFGELKYNLKYSDIFVYALELGEVIKKLSQDLDTELIFILDYSIPWLSQTNDYKPVERAMNYLLEIGVTKEYVGAFKLSGDDLAQFTSNLFWIIRCNASLPCCWFSTEMHEFVGDICVHGNIHIHPYSQKIKNEIRIFAKNNSLIEIDDCIEAFIDEEGMAGRQILI